MGRTLAVTAGQELPRQVQTKAQLPVEVDALSHRSAHLLHSRTAVIGLTTLSGGFDPELRLEIVKALIHRVDASYHALLAAHLEDIRSEAVDFGKDDLAGEAERLLKRLDAAGK